MPSLWDSANQWVDKNIWTPVDDFILPKSYAESLVDDIYGPGGTAQTGKPDPVITDPADFSSPNVFVQAKGAVTSALGSVASAANTWGTRILIGAVVLLIVLVAVNALVRR